MPSDIRAQAYYKDEIEDRTKDWKHWTEQCDIDLATLADSIAAGAVVAYVGAGPSIASRAGTKQIPGWEDLCRKLLDWAKQDPCQALDPLDFDYLEELINKGNFPLFCQILDNAYRRENHRLEHRLKEIFSTEGIEPSDAYRAIAMLPIALRLTTNYEDLLERAINGLGPAYQKTTPTSKALSLITWTDGASMLELVRSGQPGVVKIHGHIGFDRSRDVVLTKNHYRQLSSDRAFWDVLKALLSTRTFLFIGCSMSDPDIFALLDEIIEECHLIGKTAGRAQDRPPLHFALLSYGSWKPTFVRHLRDDYRIASLPVPNDRDGNPDLTPLLRLLAGAVAERTQPVLREFSPIFEHQTAEERASEIVRCTGSERADIVLEGKGRDLRHWFHWDWHLPNRHQHDPKKKSGWRDDPPQAGVISAAYVEPVDFEYAPQLSNADTGPKSADMSQSCSQTPTSSDVGTYVNWDDHSRSELAVPIMARGHRIGVLNVESYFRDAYSPGHLKFLQKEAELIGALRLEAEERDRRVRKLQSLAQPGASGLAVLIERLRALYPGADGLEGILYTPDFAYGTLSGYFKDVHKSVVHHPYQKEPSFAKDVFRTRKACFKPRIDAAIREKSINVNLAERVGIQKGPLFGCQVFDLELMCAVLVLWTKQQENAESLCPCGLERPDRQMLLATCANLIVAATKWDGDLDQVLQHINRLHSAPSQAECFVQAAQAVKALGLKRLRIWRKQESFTEIVYAWPSDYPVVGQKETWIPSLREDSNHEQPVYSEYCRRVCTRYETDPWARLQGPNVSGLGVDPLYKELLKPRLSDWIVAPVVVGIGDKNVSHTKLWGYLGADIVSKVDRNVLDADTKHFEYKEEERNWMECGMSVVAVALSSILH